MKDRKSGNLDGKMQNALGSLGPLSMQAVSSCQPGQWLCPLWDLPKWFRKAAFSADWGMCELAVGEREVCLNFLISQAIPWLSGG